MKAEAALVRADGAVHLDAKAPVHMKLAVVVAPWHPKHDDSFRLDDPLQDLVLPVFRMPLQDERKRFDDFMDRLMKLRFSWIPGLHFGHESRDVIVRQRHEPIG